MPAARSTLVATQEQNASVFSDFLSHRDAKSTDTRAITLDLLRKTYEDYHVTEVDAYKIALFDYASSGNALIHFDSKDEQFHATRGWHAVGDDTEKKGHPGKLTDDFRFAR